MDDKWDLLYAILIWEGLKKKYDDLLALLRKTEVVTGFI